MVWRNYVIGTLFITVKFTLLALPGAEALLSRLYGGLV